MTEWTPEARAAYQRLWRRAHNFGNADERADLYTLDTEISRLTARNEALEVRLGNRAALTTQGLPPNTAFLPSDPRLNAQPPPQPQQPASEGKEPGE